MEIRVIIRLTTKMNGNKKGGQHDEDKTITTALRPLGAHRLQQRRQRRDPEP